MRTVAPVAPVVQAPAAATPRETLPQITEEEARAFIFSKESGNRLDAVNQLGCYGLGQDCNNVLANACPDWRTNRECQENFWHEYMIKRYGTWTKAMEFWQARVPINGHDVGHWW